MWNHWKRIYAIVSASWLLFTIVYFLMVPSKPAVYCFLGFGAFPIVAGYLLAFFVLPRIVRTFTR